VDHGQNEEKATAQDLRVRRKCTTLTAQKPLRKESVQPEKDGDATNEYAYDHSHYRKRTRTV